MSDADQDLAAHACLASRKGATPTLRCCMGCCRLASLPAATVACVRLEFMTLALLLPDPVQRSRRRNSITMQHNEHGTHCEFLNLSGSRERGSRAHDGKKQEPQRWPDLYLALLPLPF
jgi:hypothetical protein